MQYHRRRGDRVSYTPDQTARYFSQARRYQQAQSIRPSRQESVGQNQLYYFRSDRAPTGEWCVIYNPDGGGGGEPTDPYFGLAPTCPTSPSCLPTLQYIQVTATQTGGTWINAEGNQGWWFEPDEPFTSTLYYRLPGATVEPPDPWVQLEGDPGEDDCAFGVVTVSVSEDSLAYDFYPQHYEGVQFQISYYGEPILFVDFGEGNPDESYLVPLIPPDSQDVSGVVLFKTKIVGNFNFFTGSPGNLTQIPCSYGDQPGGGGGGDDATWSCNCPDQVQSSGILSRSPWLSEKQSRSWSGANTHTLSSGPCKHIYSAALASGQPFPRPAGGNHWDYSAAPELPNFDYTPDASDWTDQDYEAWRNQQQQRRLNENFQRAAQSASRRAANQQSFDRLGIGDQSVPRNRYLQQRYRELYEQAQANPEAQDALDDFLLDLE